MTKNRKPSQHDHVESAIANLIASGSRRLLDNAAWLAESLPARRRNRALRSIVQAVQASRGW